MRVHLALELSIAFLYLPAFFQEFHVALLDSGMSCNPLEPPKQTLLSCSLKGLRLEYNGLDLKEEHKTCSSG